MRKGSFTDSEVIGTSVARPTKTAAKKAKPTFGAGPKKTITIRECGLTVDKQVSKKTMMMRFHFVPLIMLLHSW